MNKRFILYIFLSLSFAIHSQEKISAYSHHIIDLYNKSKIENAQSRRLLNKLAVIKTESETSKVETLIELNDNAEFPTEYFDKLNISVINSIDNILIVSMPIENISKLTDVDAIKTISIARKIRPLNDKARSVTKVNDVHTGTDLPHPFTGSDVVVGIVDIGIDFNHINFKDENGTSRVKIAAAYDAQKKTTLVYNTPEDIATLTTDSSNDSHGTHVAGIATGSYYGNNFYGMAPESDIILYGLGYDMSTTNILNGVKTVFDYADSVNKPAVVNMSLGTNIGSHDGSDSFNKALDKLTGNGKIILIASGNEGSDNLYIKNVFSETNTTTPQFSTIVNAASTTYDCIIDSWSNNAEPIGIQFFIYNSITKSEEISSSIFYPSSGTSRDFTWNSSSLSTYFNGTITAFGMKSSSNNRYEMYSYINGKTTSGRYLIGIKYYGKQNSEVNSWVSGGEFDNMDNSNYIAGTPDGSYNDLGCGKESITVGAYSSKTFFSTIGGNIYSYNATEGDIAYFSSYGTDYTGRNHPDITAPGFTLVSSVNNYDYATTTTNKAYLVNIVSPTNSTRKYHWGDMSGTSMATPVATGTVALWLQANPNLTPSEVKSIMQSTATNDSFTQTGNSIKWGAGKLNAHAGILKVLQSSAISDISIPDKIVMIYPNPSNGNFTAYIHSDEDNIKFCIYSINGALVYNDRLPLENGIINVNLNNLLTSGIYIVNMQGKNFNHTERLIIK